MDVRVITPGEPGVDRSVIYECNFAVDAPVAKDFIAYLKQHMQEIVHLEEGALFDRATLCVAENEGVPDSDRCHLCARYRARSRFRLQEYFDTAGERLRQDMLQKWNGRFTVQRRILAVEYVIE
jgi:hypothetical protein